MSNPALPASAERSVFTLRASLILNGGLFLVLLAFWLKMAGEGVFWRADFTAFYTGWSMVLDGQGARLYDLALQESYQQRALPEPNLYEGLLPFAHPPHAALLLAPFALLPRGAAFYAWALFQAGLCGIAWRQIAWLTRDWSGRARWALMFALLGFPPVFMSFQQGQTGIFSLVCLLGFVIGLKQRRPWATALWLVLASVKPQLAVIPVAILLGGRRWRELVIAAGVFSLWAALSALVLGWESWWNYPGYLRFSSRQFGTFGIDPLRMYNLKGLLTALLGAQRIELINLLTTAVLLLNVAVVLWLWRGPWRPDSPAFDLRLSCTLLLAIVCNPHVNGTDLLLLAPAALLFVEYRRHEGLPLTGVAPVLLLCPLLLLIDAEIHPWPALLRPFFLLMLAATGWLITPLSAAPSRP
jgi:hypothetical protein